MAEVLPGGTPRWFPQPELPERNSGRNFPGPARPGSPRGRPQPGPPSTGFPPALLPTGLQRRRRLLREGRAGRDGPFPAVSVRARLFIKLAKL